MIAGYFAVMSCDRYGPQAFLKNRLARLGIPTVVFGLIMILLTVFVFGAKDGKLGQAWPVNVAHMWFVEHLILYSAVYALWRTIPPSPRRRRPEAGEPARLSGDRGLCPRAGRCDRRGPHLVSG